VEPMRIALWGIPTAISAFVIHAYRLSRLDGTLDREMGYNAEAAPAKTSPTATASSANSDSTGE